MQSILNLFLFTSAALALTGCASSQFLQIESDPVGADVYLSISGQSSAKVGQTPLQLQSSQIPSGAEAQISISKGNLKSETVFLPATNFSKSGKIFIKLTDTQLPIACLQQEASMQKLARGIAESQAMIKSKELDQSEQKLVSLSGEFSNVSVIYDLLGNIHYLKKDLDKALIAYRKSISLNPNNLETTRIIQKIEQIKGGSL